MLQITTSVLLNDLLYMFKKFESKFLILIVIKKKHRRFFILICLILLIYVLNKLLFQNYSSLSTNGNK